MNPNRDMLNTSDALVEKVEQASLADEQVDDDLFGWIEWLAECVGIVVNVTRSPYVVHRWLMEVQAKLMAAVTFEGEECEA